MKPLNAILALGLSLLIVGAAGARNGDRHGDDRGRGGDRGGDRGGRREQIYAPPRGAERGPMAYPGRSAPSGPAFAPRGYARPDYPGYAPGYGPGYAPEPRNWGRGQFLPRGYWAGQAVDPRRYRLRTPPPGYGWYGIGRDAYLVQRSTGLILDTAPGAW